MTLPRKRMLFGLTALAGIATLLLVMTWSNWAPETEASNEAADTVMSMQIDGMLDGSPVHCDTANGDTKCTLDDGGPFTVAMIPSTIPPGGYGFWQWLLQYGTLLYKPGPLEGGTDDGGEMTWDLDFLPLRSPAFPTGLEGEIGYGNLSSFGQPLPLSQQKTALVTIDMNCTSSDTLSVPAFDVRPDGAIYGGEFDDDLFRPDAHSIEINCGAPPPTETPTPTVTLTPTVTPTPCPEGKVPSNGGCGTPIPTATPTETPTVTNTPVPPEFACGDVNGDEQVSSVDSLWILWLVAGIVDELAVPEVADLNKDGEIGSIDSLFLLQFSAGLIESLNCNPQ